MPSRRRLLAAVALAFAGAALPAVAAPVEAPEAFIAAIYARITAGDGTKGGAEFTEAKAAGRWFTRAVVVAWQKAEAKAEKDGEIGPIDFDLLTDSQDPQVRSVAIAPRGTTPTGATVRVGLFAAKKPKPGAAPYTTLDFVLKQENGGWRIDDVKKVSSEPWTLRGILTMP
jgi:hypothetical protein